MISAWLKFLEAAGAVLAMLMSIVVGIGDLHFRSEKNELLKDELLKDELLKQP